MGIAHSLVRMGENGCVQHWWTHNLNMHVMRGTGV